jgi:hypothetical protein
MDRLDSIMRALHNEMRLFREEAYSRGQGHERIPSATWDEVEAHSMEAGTDEPESPEIREAHGKVAKTREEALMRYKELLSTAEGMEHRAEQLRRAAGIWEQLASQ